MALSLWRQFSGESAVVSLYVVSVLYSTPLSLIPEASFLFLLSLFSLSVEIVADDVSNPLAKVFKTRPGASSGIFLSAVTLPGVILSRLIQTQRAEDEIGYAGLQYLRLQYWSTVASCLTVLIYLFWVSQHHVESTNRTHSGFSRSLIYIFVCFILFGGVGMVALCMRSSAWLSMLMSLWLLSHGLGAVLLMKKILHTFCACASIGESLLVTVGLVVYFGDMVAYTATKILYLESSTLLSIQDAFKRSEIATIIQGMLFFLLLFPVIYKNILRISGFCVNQRINEDIRNHEVRKTIVFFALLAVTLIFIAPSWMQYVHVFRVHPLLWILYFVLSEPSKRLPLCIYWLVVICVSVRQFYSISKNGTTERILLRKYYHLMAVCIFVPALVFQPRFLDLAFGAALAVFLLLEIIRIWGIWPLGYTIQRFMTAFTDHRDSDLLIVSHFSLLLGCAIPIWLSSGFNDRPLAPFAGILSLGIGDTMASMVGHKYGVLRWSKTGKKTIEGTAAGITAVLAACFLLLPLLATSGCIFTMHWKSLFVAVTISGLLEAYTAQLDNAFIPLIFYSLLCL